MIWRLVLAHIATLEEIGRSWSINDLMDAHEALDIQQEAEEYAQWEAKRKQKGK